MASSRRCEHLDPNAKKEKKSKTIKTNILQSWLEAFWQSVSSKSRFERAVEEKEKAKMDEWADVVFRPAM